MLKLKMTDYDLIPDRSFPPYWMATDAELESALYDSDSAGDEGFYTILTFDDIRSDFNGWTPKERAEYLQDDDSPDYTVHDWIRDCLMNSLSIIKGITRRKSLSLPKLMRATCNYTGGGIYVYTALYNDEVWLTTDFDLAGSYDLHPDEVEQDLLPDGAINYDGHWKKPSVPYPTWGDILSSVRRIMNSEQEYRQIKNYVCNHHRLSDPIIEKEGI